MKQHQRSIHEGQKYKCAKCSYEFNIDRSLQEHIRFVHEGSGYKCDECEFKSRRYYELKAHKYKYHIDFRLPTKEKTFQCKNCEKKFFQLTHLERHEIRHTLN